LNIRILDNRLIESRLFSALIGIFSITLAFRDGGLMQLLIGTSSFYMPIVTVPFIMALLGFRSTEKSVLIGMFAGFLTVILWDYVFSKPFFNLDSLIPAMISNLVALVSSHYLLKQNGGWVGIRTTKSMVNLYVDLTFNSDKRAQFYRNGQNLEINDLTKFTDGYAVTKFRNKTKAGVTGTDETFVDIDMPLFRVAEMYLIYAEAHLRSNAAAGSASTALGYMNALRERAYGNTSGNITSGQLTTDYILDERARELMWEGFRRTDLIRYDKFVESTYLWPWKGGAKDGTSVAAYRKLYPLPAKDLAVNLNLKQNTGY
jgi:hypothetical protein